MRTNFCICKNLGNLLSRLGKLGIWNQAQRSYEQQIYEMFCYSCRKLPKAMKEWPAYKDLKQMIDDFSETCPLLEMMANKAMKDRHWARLEKLTGCTFDIESEAFTLKSLLEAPMLKHMDDVVVRELKLRHSFTVTSK